VLRLPRKMTTEISMQHAAPATKTATHLVKTTQKYCARRTKRFSTRHQTGWNVTKRRAKQHYDPLGNLRKGHVLQLPP